MIPSQKWFPSSLQERAAWFGNFETQFSVNGLGTTLGFVAADMTAVTNDNAAMQFVADLQTGVDAYADAVRQYRKIITEGNDGDPAPAEPLAPTGGLPLPVPATGIFERLDDLVKRIRVSPTYTDEAGAILGIIPSKGDSLFEEDMKPSLKAVAMPGNVVDVSFVRGQTDGIAVEIQIDGAGGWVSSGRFFKSPGSLDIPTGTGLPRAVQIRARFVVGNDPIGLNSDTVNVVTTP